MQKSRRKIAKPVENLSSATLMSNYENLAVSQQDDILLIRRKRFVFTLGENELKHFTLAVLAGRHAVAFLNQV